MDRRFFLSLFIQCCIFLLLPELVVTGRAAAQSESCVTSSCHSTLGKDKVVHNPVKEQMCTICHQAIEDPQKKTKHPNNLLISLVQQGSELCSMCHEPKNVKKTIHAPIMGGDCISCHNPHQSSETRLLREKRPQLCFQCHDESIIKNKSVHSPVKEGKCNVCHDPHQSDLPKLLSKGGNDLCLSCHTQMNALLQSGKVVHPAVQQGCIMCHTPHSSANDRLLAKAAPAVCEQCHEPKNTKKVVHAPIMGGDCTSCHNPHLSSNKGLLKAVVPDLCFQCHSDSMMKHNVMHPPVASGDCSGCHDNHQSDYPNRLLLNGNALCFQCHPDKEEGIKTKKTVHYPVKESCVQCHNPHGTAFPAMLSASVPELCSNCHPNEVLAGQRSMSKHGPMTDQKSCRNCHDPHFSDQPRLLITAQMALCLSCHDKELETGKGKIMNMKNYLQNNKNGHGPVKSADCVSCHGPHGTNYWRILVQYYPPEFYTPFSEGKYALCFSCHDKSSFTNQRTSAATGFRNGTQNLHFLHVNKISKGRTCRACHEIHADTEQPKHVKQNVLFSGWSMPMNFVPSKDGGTCAPGCHGEKRYVR